MTPKEFLKQAYRLDQKIDSDISEASRLRDIAASVSSPGFEENYDPNRPTEASFVHSLERVWELEQKVNAEIDRLVALKEQIRTVIDKVENPDEQMVLRYRYIHNWTWEQIGNAQEAKAPLFLPRLPQAVRWAVFVTSIPSWRPSATIITTATRKLPNGIMPNGEKTVSCMFRLILCVRNVCELGDTRPPRWSIIFSHRERAALMQKITSWLFAILVMGGFMLREGTVGIADKVFTF